MFGIVLEEITLSISFVMMLSKQDGLHPGFSWVTVEIVG